MEATVTTYYFDMDGVLANFHKAYDVTKRYLVMKRDWIANLEPFVDNVNLVRELIANGNNVYILTACASEDAKLGKLDWLAKYIPEITIEKFICLVGSGKKVNYIKEDGMLIDDTKSNINAWVKEGHKGYWLEEKGAKILL